MPRNLIADMRWPATIRELSQAMRQRPKPWGHRVGSPELRLLYHHPVTLARPNHQLSVVCHSPLPVTLYGPLRCTPPARRGVC